MIRDQPDQLAQQITLHLTPYSRQGYIESFTALKGGRIERLQHVQMKNLDATTLIRRYNEEDCLNYSDLPYFSKDTYKTTLCS